ncbi:hypothetical protein MMC13_002381 [Lambiella insularis]|nr:hypothetical protein [Lambiella insularis]
MAYDPPQRVETNLTAQTNFTTVEEDEWRSKNLLSLGIEENPFRQLLRANPTREDGGGIRGYWSLLALEKLMKHIGEMEEEQEHYHSFSPLDWPPHGVSQLVPATQKQSSIEDFTSTDNPDVKERCRNIPSARRYLPCHYFDYICGSSTGALIAIMLGRFRMTVDDCKHEYRTLGEKVFGRPRLLSTIRFGIADRMKYKSAGLKNVFEEVAIRRCERSRDVPQRVTFPSKRGLCKTIVTTEKFESESMESATLYLIRSYDHEERDSLKRPRRIPGDLIASSSRANTGMSGGFLIEEPESRPQDSKRNYGKAQKLEIWEVARAATAALFYFEPLRLAVPGPSKHIFLTDAGIKYTNNPTKVGTREIEDMHGKSAIGIVVSVGTARHDERPKPKGLVPAIDKIKATIGEGADPKIVHNDVLYESQNQYQYYRLDDPKGLKMELDEWKPKRTPFKRRQDPAPRRSRQLSTLSTIGSRKGRILTEKASVTTFSDAPKHWSSAE